jgi:hypothetical protein
MIIVAIVWPDEAEFPINFPAKRVSATDWLSIVNVPAAESSRICGS